MNTKGVTVKNFQNPDLGIDFVKQELYRITSPQTILFLSGGNTPKSLYKQLAKEKKLHCVLALVDERFGKPFHENSNAYLVREAGIENFVPILKSGKTLGETAEQYCKKVEELFITYSHRVAIMGVGEDGHTAGVPAESQIANLKSQKEKLVAYFEDFPGPFKQRISLTLSALSRMDLLILLVFGEGKKDALKKMFEQGSEEEIPARFYTRPKIAEKTLLITDQTV